MTGKSDRGLNRLRNRSIQRSGASFHTPSGTKRKGLQDRSKYDGNGRRRSQ